MKLSKQFFYVLFSAFAGCRASHAQNPQVPDSAFIKENYIKAEYQIPMRDGKKLFTVVYSPKGQSESYPFMLDRTPYSAGPYGKEKYKQSIGPSSWFVHDKYIFVYQDVRGRWMSEGIFLEMTPEKDSHKTRYDVDEGTDTYDTVDWLIKNIKHNNGKLGVWGISYPGFFTTASLLSRHPALVCASPQAPMADLYRDDAFHYGAFMLVGNFSFYPFFTNRQNDKPTQRIASEFDPGTKDGYDFYLRMATIRNTNALYYKDSIRLWNEMLDHPDYDSHWKERNILPHLTDIKTPVLVTGGWYDAEDLYGAIHTYKTIKQNNPQTPAYFVMGPWVHGGWANSDGDHLGDIDFDQKCSLFYREKIEFPFFSHYLKGTPLTISPVTVFETGENKWRSFARWPNPAATKKKLYLLPGSSLGFTQQKGSETSYDEFISDPAKPVPFIDKITTDMEREYMTADQRFAARRPDVLTYQTAVLNNPVTLAGNIMANLEVSTSGTDADWVVKLIDVYPDSAMNTKWTMGTSLTAYQQMVRSEAFRGKYRNDLSKPQPFIPGTVTPVKFELQDILHTFKPGHRIMVQVQSTWFPLIDRNPQQFMNIMKAQPKDFKKASNRVYTSVSSPSYLTVEVL